MKFAKLLLSQANCDYDKLRDGFLKMVIPTQEMVSSSKIKQVYFPVDDGEYHLLSLLTHSGHLFELRKRIDAIRFGEESKIARECKRNNHFHASGHSKIFGLTTIGFGGTKPQNISVLNNKNAGKAHLLASVPPQLRSRNLRLPKKDFFKESFTFWDGKNTLEALDSLFKTDYNNINIREGRDYRIQEYVDMVIHRMWEIRVFLTEYLGELSTDLQAEQKIWLYPEFEQQRLESDEWLETIIRDISRSLINHYKKVIRNPISLADEELLTIQRIVTTNKEALR